MHDSPAAVLYLHGFNSAPASAKARICQSWCEREGLSVAVPALPFDPAVAISELEARVAATPPQLVIGSSLGGFYATWLAEKFDLKAALINPAVKPCAHLGEEFLGPQRNHYTGEQWEFTRAHAASLTDHTLEQLQRPENFLLLLQTGDEVLDYRHALDYYLGSTLWVEQGGSHAFENFESVLPQIAAFSGLDQAPGRSATSHHEVSNDSV